VKLFTYTAYGIGIHSVMSFPELICRDAPADVIIRPSNVSYLRSEESTEEYCIRATADEAYIFWKDIGAFRIKAGREITYAPAPGVDEGLLRLIILGPVLAALLHLRGHLVLHASAVASPGGAMIFLGGSGWGKSTIAATLCSYGYPLVADDVLAVHQENGSHRVFPGIPRIKIWPETAQALGYNPDHLPKLYSLEDKRALYTDSGSLLAPLHIKCIYVIDEGASLRIEPMTPQEAMVEAIRHSSYARYLVNSRAAVHFGQCASLVKNTLFRRLRIDFDLSTLHDLPRMLVDDIAIDT